MRKLKALLLIDNNFPCTCEVYKELWDQTALLGVECLDGEGLRQELFDFVKCDIHLFIIGGETLPIKNESKQFVEKVLQIQTTSMNPLLHTSDQTAQLHKFQVEIQQTTLL